MEPPHSYRSLREALSSGKALREKYKATSVSDLKKLSAKAIVGEMNTQHHLTVDGYALPDSPYNLRRAGIHNEESILHGFNDKLYWISGLLADDLPKNSRPGLHNT